jgi:hypothetical protein
VLEIALDDNKEISPLAQDTAGALSWHGNEAG